MTTHSAVSRFLTSVTLAVLTTLIAPPAHAWIIREMSVDITVARDASLDVRETIEVDFGEEQRHGIYREIPVRESGRQMGGRRVRVRVLAVTDGAGAIRRYRARRSGRYVSVRIGDPAAYVTAVQRYVIRYRVENGILFFPDHDELYWNATGNEWPVAINRASCVVRLPVSSGPQRLQANAWVGSLGSTERAEVDLAQNGAVFRSPRPLGFAEGLTVALGWPKGIVQPPSMARKVVWFLLDNVFVLIPAIFLLAMTIIWRVYGRDPAVGQSVAVRYEPPGDLRPAEVGTLVDEMVDTRDIAATIVDLAVRGYLTIEEGPSGILLGKRTYTLRKTAEPGSRDRRGQLAPYEKTIYEKLFASGDSVTTEDLENSFYLTVGTASDQLYADLARKGLFLGHPDRVRKVWLESGWFVFGAGVFLLYIALSDESGNFPLEPGWGLAAAVCGLIAVAFSRLMPRKTFSGKRAALEILGFEEYLSRAEKEDLKLQEKKGIFETFLPYAISLKVVEQWARAFEGILDKNPDWFIGAEGPGRFRPVIFARSINAACSGLGSAMTSAPRSASGGGSAFGGGGGFSGGGFGGGGGRAW
ncbi:MAG: hypothetical protein KatS3mg024_0400 [Armatimonadota bacterium]|nr:MAG: hypothetical protein KatS3mg024_0400 [Armatimonadota bacterium]